MGTDCSDPIHFVYCLVLCRTAQKRKLCLAGDLLHENWNPVILVVRVLDLNDKNGSKCVGRMSVLDDI